MGLLSKLLGGQKTLETGEVYNSEEYNKIVARYGKSKADDIMDYWIQAYLCYASGVAHTDASNAEQLPQLVFLITRELVNARGKDFATRVLSIRTICNEEKLAEEIDAVERYIKNPKLHWMKELNVEY